MRRFPIFLLLLLMGLAVQAEAQRGGRGDGSRRRANPRSAQNDLSDLKFVDRLWFGAGGTLGFQGANGQSFTQIGLTPQVGYKINDWLSAGPRFGATLSLIKGPVVRQDGSGEEIRRYSTMDYTFGGFVRGRFRQFYAQTEFNTLSVGFAPRDRFSGFAAVADDETNEVIKDRVGDQQLQIGIGYAPQTGGSIGTDFGVFYNLFDDVRSLNTSPIELRIQLTFRY